MIKPAGAYAHGPDRSRILMKNEEETGMLFEELSKIKRSSIMTSIILAAFGVVMIVCPPQYVDSLIAVLGYGMLILAFVLILSFISAKSR